MDFDEFVKEQEEKAAKKAADAITRVPGFGCGIRNESCNGRYSTIDAMRMERQEQYMYGLMGLDFGEDFDGV